MRSGQISIACNRRPWRVDLCASFREGSLIGCMVGLNRERDGSRANSTVWPLRITIDNVQCRLKFRNTLLNMKIFELKDSINLNSDILTILFGQNEKGSYEILIFIYFELNYLIFICLIFRRIFLVF